jgi:hypothetical protein
MSPFGGKADLPADLSERQQLAKSGRRRSKQRDCKVGHREIVAMSRIRSIDIARR